jgi:putative membrane protein
MAIQPDVGPYIAGVPLPYCGLPPAPDAIWSRWNLDSVLIACLIGCAVAYAWAIASREQIRSQISGWRQALFYIGWAVTAFALVSPLCPLSVSLFSARVGQHMVLVLIAAPLVAAGRPLPMISSLWRRSHKPTASAAPLCAAALFAIMIWFWHSPAPYAETFRSTFVYWSMHVTVFGTAIWLWSSLFDAPDTATLRVVFAGLISSIQMGFLGALITFASRPFYTPHLLTTVAWGLTPLQDQQLGGAIMWVPGCAAFLIISTLVVWKDIVRVDAQPRARAVAQ